MSPEADKNCFFAYFSKKIKKKCNKPVTFGTISVTKAIELRAYNKMTLYSSGLFSVWPASGCIDNLSRLPASPSLPDEKTLAFGTTIHFVRGS